MQIILTEVFFETEEKNPKIAKAIMFIAKRVKYKYRTYIPKEDILEGYGVSNIEEVEEINNVIKSMCIAKIKHYEYNSVYEVCWNNGNTSAHIIFYEEHTESIEYIQDNANMFLTEPWALC